jgi:hypothetical protein
MIERILITSLIVFAIWATMWEGAIFEFVRTWGEKNLSEKMQKPIYDCPVCMCFWYGTALYWIVWGVSIKEYLIVVVAAMGLNAVLIKLMPDP